VLLAVYRPGSQALSTAFFDELLAVFECIATYGCPVQWRNKALRGPGSTV